MLYLLFELGNEPYALETGSVIGLLPFDVERVVPVAPGSAGTIDFDDRPVPVIDLCSFALGRSAERRFSTRIVLIDRAVRGETRVLGLVVERATQTTRRKPNEFTPAKRDAGALLARIDTSGLFPEAIAGTHFPASLAAGPG